MASPALRAWQATALFAAAGIGGAWGGPDRGVIVPLGLSYAMLVAHTYRSVRCFSAIVPAGLRDQRAVDVCLVVAYLALATSLAAPVRFLAVAALLFVVATLKYALLLGRLEASELLARKIRVDALGAVAAILGLLAATEGHGRAAAWTLLGVQVVADLVLLWWRPLYRLAPAAQRRGAGA